MIISPVRNMIPRREFDYNSVPGLIVDLDARDLLPGPITSWFDRKNNYEFVGTCTRDTEINGKPSVTFAGTDFMISSALVTQLSGSKVITAIGAYKDSHSTESSVYVVGTKSPGPTGIEWLLYVFGGANHVNNYVQNAIAGDSTQFQIINNLNTPIVLTVSSDLTIANETELFRVNGTVEASVQNINTNTLVSYDSGNIFIGASPSAASYWPGSLSKLLIYATNTAVEVSDLLNIERAIGTVVDIVTA